MIYKINRLCILNQETPTPCKERMEVAINIVPVRKNNKFENFLLGIDWFQECYENFGHECTLGEGFNVEKFVESIEVDVDIPDSLCPCNDFDCGGIFGVKINIRDESPVYAWVYNIHNGYYCHAIYYTDDSLRVDCFETDYL